MKKVFIFVALFMFIFGCASEYKLKNNTKPMGYAMGSDVKLSFVLDTDKNVPDSIGVRVLESKSRYVYTDYARLAVTDDSSVYVCEWNGRKPDGSWPIGGRYYVSASVQIENTIYSDTVEIGLTD